LLWPLLLSGSKILVIRQGATVSVIANIHILLTLDEYSIKLQTSEYHGRGRIIQGRLGKLLPGNGATYRERKEREGRKKGKGKKGKRKKGKGKREKGKEKGEKGREKERKRKKRKNIEKEKEQKEEKEKEKEERNKRRFLV